MVRKNNEFAVFKLPFLHNTVLILCDEGAGLVAYGLHANIYRNAWEVNLKLDPEN